MSTLLGSYRLYSPSDGADREVGLYEGIDAEDVAFVEAQWRPTLKQQQQLAEIRLKASGDLSDANYQRLLDEVGAPDAHWEWAKIADPSVLTTSRAYYAVKSDKRVEALIALDLSRRCLLQSQKNEHMIYIDYLAVAPWNRSQIKTPRELGGLGEMMLAVAIERSREEGWKGRVGLHSLSQSENFYSRRGMTRVMRDSAYQDLWYFEFTPESATDFAG